MRVGCLFTAERLFPSRASGGCAGPSLAQLPSLSEEQYPPTLPSPEWAAEVAPMNGVGWGVGGLFLLALSLSGAEDLGKPCDVCKQTSRLLTPKEHLVNRRQLRSRTTVRHPPTHTHFFFFLTLLLSPPLVQPVTFYFPLS